jgi:site-specific DNA-cytosine methylase
MQQLNPKLVQRVEIKHFGLFCGIGGGAKGFNKGHARVGKISAVFRCIGGIDNDAAAIEDFNKIAGVRGTVRDLFSRQQYIAFHGHEPPPDWSEATPADIRRAANDEFPNIVFLSAPCKGFSGLLSGAKSGTDKYLALNELTVRGVWLACEAFKDDLPEFFIFENVPRIRTRGRKLLDQIVAILRHYGYAVAETEHDCGELGKLGQSRKRFLLVARNTEKVPAFLYEPEKHSLVSVGSLLGRMPLPGDPAAGPMHRVPNLQWKTWVRLAFVRAGSDWRSLNDLAVVDGYLRDFLIVPDLHRGVLGVNDWGDSMGTVPGSSLPTNGAYSVADPRFEQSAKWHDGQALGVRDWKGPTGTIPAQTSSPMQGAHSVADPRHHGEPKFNNEYRVNEWDREAAAIHGAGGKGQCVQDPRPPQGRKLFGKYAIVRMDQHTGTVISGDDSGAYGVADPRGESFGKYPVTAFDDHTHTIIAGSTTGQGAFAVADPRANCERSDPYGVIPWDTYSGTVPSSGNYDNSRLSVADPRLPNPADKLVAIIRALDNTWHRPFTTLELAVLQSLVEPEEHLELCGLSDQAWRERIGNLVPPASAEVIASVMGEAILLSRTGETFFLSEKPIWVRPIATAISVDTSRQFYG